jgi:hypothetical protein
MHAKSTRCVFTGTRVPKSRYAALRLASLYGSKLQHDKLLRGDARYRFIVASAVHPIRGTSVPHQRVGDRAFSSGR